MNKNTAHEAIFHHRQNWRIWVTAVAAIAAAILLAWLTILVIRLPDSTLARVSDAGQAFGVLSAIFSAAALAGVVVSVVHQGRQNWYYRYETWHNAQFNFLIASGKAPPAIAADAMDASMTSTVPSTPRSHG